MEMDTKVERKTRHVGRWIIHIVSIMVLVVILWTVTVSDSFKVNAAASSTSVGSGSIIQHPYLTIQVLKQKKPIVIQPGMTKLQVDQLLGKPTEIESSSFKGYSYNTTNSTLFIGYLNEKVASIFTTGYESSINGQFKFGTPWKKVLAKFGQPSEVKEQTFDYVYQVKNGKLKQIYGTAIQEMKGSADVYTLRFDISTSGNLQSIFVEQAAFTQAMEDRDTKPEPTKPSFTEEEINGISNGKGKPISLGMRRETVEATNGRPDGNLFYSRVVMDSYGAVSVYYRENIVAAMVVDLSPVAQTNKVLGMSTSRKEVLHIYGEPTYNGQSSVEYAFEAVGDRLQAMSFFKSIDQRYLQNKKYSLTFIANESNPDQIEYFILNDSDFFYDENNIPKPPS
ncbi:CAP-associated domain-containing protein [Paenibacillus chibensis]|uniref:CAP-associated domain-containing protein n=1 Tax=Paenibacillus chibensis TaxID=59846 RepID=A0ABU6PPK7_9BACL|nr:CAP-associated domain-containing protein [Paenibacillus chibensis]